MGAFLDKPITKKHNDYGEGNQLRFGVSSMQGWRYNMEDAYYARARLGGIFDDFSFFAVFDGHGSPKVSEHCSKHLLDCIMGTREFCAGDLAKGLYCGFLRIDEVMRKLPEFRQEMGGTTAVCALITPTQIYIANCGDSRAVLCRQGIPVCATEDHKPYLPNEKRRIQNAGGIVTLKRVNGTLAISRTLGDYSFKNDKNRGQCEQLVSPEPDIICERRHANDEFLVIACDGIWDVMTNIEVCNFIRARLLVTDDLVSIANQVLDASLRRDSKDNMSIIIITFPGAPKPHKSTMNVVRQLALNC